MHFKNTIFIGAALLGTASAWAQQNPSTSSVAIYGLLDEGIEHVSGMASTAGTNTSSWRVGAGMAASRWGMRGSEDLGGGLSSVFALEAGIGADTGTAGQGGRAFGRQSFVGLNGGFGSLTLGRQYTMRYYGLLDADIFGAGSQGLGTLDSGIPNARADNSISYRGTWGAFTGGANFSMGRDGVNGNSVAATNCPGESGVATQCREWSVLAKYDAGHWGVVSAYEKQYGGTSTTFGGLTSPNLTDSRFTLNGYFKLGDNRFGVGWLKRDNQGITTPKSDLYWVVGSLPVTEAFSIDTMLAELKYDNSPNKALLFTLRGNYALSKRTVVYLSGAFINNGGTLALAATTNTPATPPVPGGSQNSIIAGVKHTF